ncbi:MAG: murein biosynthesis integral membrane protein MurJ [Verrucomicrobia bacterium]|nr:murein biosynthesis integral membrane protein MurJ [Verrucomicrobiota bacterium]
MSKSLKNISVVAVATMASRVLGLVRESLTAAVFGTSALVSAFFTAFQLPNLFRRLLGEGALTAAFVPTLNEELEQRQRAGAFVLVSQVASWLLVVSVVLVAAVMALLSRQDWVGGVAAACGADEKAVLRWQEAAQLSVLLFPYLIFVCMAAAFSAALQSIHRFLEPALSPIWLNLAMIVLLGGSAYYGWADTSEGEIHWLCAGVLIGGCLQMLVPAVTLMREGWTPRFDLRMSAPVRAILRLMGPTVFGSAIYLINMTVSRLVGLSLNDTAVAVLNFAQRLMELPIGVFAVAISTVVFPLISRYAAQGDYTNLTHAYRKGMRLILMINTPAALGLTVLATPIVRLLFQRGAFSESDTHLMVPVMAAYALGLPFFSFVNLVLRAFYAQKDTVTPVRAAAWSFVVNLALSLALMGPLSTVGLALAGNLAIVVQAWYLQRALARKRPSLAFHHLVRDLVKIIGASLLMGVAVAAGWWGWQRLMPPTHWADAAALVVLIGAGVAVYAGLLWAFKIEGRDDLIALWRRRRAAT